MKLFGQRSAGRRPAAVGRAPGTRRLLFALVMVVAAGFLEVLWAKAAHACVGDLQRPFLALPPGWPLLWRESAHDELVRLQGRYGLTLVTIQGYALRYADFKRYTMRKYTTFPSGMAWISPKGGEVAGDSRLGTGWSLAIMRPDGSNLRQFPEFRDVTDFCWSGDASRLAFRASLGSKPEEVWILDVDPGAYRETGAVGHLTSQCWSPDDNRIVYSDGEAPFELESRVRLLDLATLSSSDVASGMHATWSPDGNWIAYYDQDTYYSIRPSGGDSRKLFKKWHATSGLLWSPDGRLVAFASQAGLFEGQLPTIDVEVYWLRVRRLEDGSETRVAGSYGDGNYQWLSSPEFIPK